MSVIVSKKKNFNTRTPTDNNHHRERALVYLLFVSLCLLSLSLSLSLSRFDTTKAARSNFPLSSSECIFPFRVYCDTLKSTASNFFSLDSWTDAAEIYTRAFSISSDIIIMSPLSSSETQALLNGDEQKRTSKSSSSFTSPLKAATAIVAVSTSLFATASYSVSGTRGSSSSRLGDLSQREGGVDLFKRAVANLGEDATTTTTASAIASGSNDKVTLTVGCSHRDVLKRLPFDPEGWDSKVGAKLITESKSKTFSYEDAIEMKEIGCGKFQTPYKLGSGAKFGFYLYEKANPENYVSDIGGKLVLLEEEEEEEAAIGETAASSSKKKMKKMRPSSSVLKPSATTNTESSSSTTTDYVAQAVAAEMNACAFPDFFRVVVGERREEEARVLEEIGEKARRRRNRGRGIRGRCG